MLVLGGVLVLAPSTLVLSKAIRIGGTKYHI